MKRNKYLRLFKSVMKENFENKVKKGKGKKPPITIGAFGHSKIERKRKLNDKKI